MSILLLNFFLVVLSSCESDGSYNQDKILTEAKDLEKAQEETDRIIEEEEKVKVREDEISVEIEKATGEKGSKSQGREQQLKKLRAELQVLKKKKQDLEKSREQAKIKETKQRDLAQKEQSNKFCNDSAAVSPYTRAEIAQESYAKPYWSLNVQDKTFYLAERCVQAEGRIYLFAWFVGQSCIDLRILYFSHSGGIWKGTVSFDSEDAEKQIISKGASYIQSYRLNPKIDDIIHRKKLVENCVSFPEDPIRKFLNNNNLAKFQNEQSLAEINHYNELCKRPGRLSTPSAIKIEHTIGLSHECVTGPYSVVQAMAKVFVPGDGFNESLRSLSGLQRVKKYNEAVLKLKQDYSEMWPNFTGKPISEYKIHNDYLSKPNKYDISVELYPAKYKARDIEWHIASKDKMAWIHRLRFKDSEVNSYLSDGYVLSVEAMQLKPIEYATQINGMRDWAKDIPATPTYKNILQFIQFNALIAEYRKARGWSKLSP